VLALDETDPTKSHVEALIDVASVETRDLQRDGHLKSADFFDVEKYPTMKFESTKVTVTGAAEGTVAGDLTIRERDQAVVFDVEGPTRAEQGPVGNERVGVAATAKISRKDFGADLERGAGDGRRGDWR